MTALAARDSVLVEYLLGGLTAEERERLEEQAFVDDAAHEDLEATADDLIHAYLAGALPQEDRARFEAHFLASPRRRERVEFLRSLLAAVDRVSTRKPATAWQSWALAAAVILGLTAALALLARPTGRETQQAAASPGPVASAPPTPAPRQTPIPPTPPSPGIPDLRVVRLSPEAGAEAMIALAPGTAVVRFEIAVDRDRPSFDAVIRAMDGHEVWRAAEMAPASSGEPLRLTVPARLLVAGRYTLSVEGELLRGTPGPRVRKYGLRVVRER